MTEPKKVLLLIEEGDLNFMPNLRRILEEREDIVLVQGERHNPSLLDTWQREVVDLLRRPTLPPLGEEARNLLMYNRPHPPLGETVAITNGPPKTLDLFMPFADVRENTYSSKASEKVRLLEEKRVRDHMKAACGGEKDEHAREKAKAARKARKKNRRK